MKNTILFATIFLLLFSCKKDFTKQSYQFMQSASSQSFDLSAGADIGNFTGAETGGMEETAGQQGATGVTNVNKKDGNYSYFLQKSGATIAVIQFDQFESGKTDCAGNYVIEFDAAFSDITPSTNNWFWGIVRANQYPDIKLRHKTNGTFDVLQWNDSVLFNFTYSITARSYYHFAIWYERSQIGNYTVRIGDSLVASGSGDLNSNTAISQELVKFENFTTDTIWFDNMLTICGATSDTDRLGTTARVSRAYQVTNASGSHGGDAWTSGNDSLVSQLPLNETANNIATLAANKSTYMTTDLGIRYGCLNDANAGTSQAMKTVMKFKQSSSGSPTTFYMLQGNSTDGVTEFPLSSPTTSFKTFIHLTTSTSIMPTSSESARHGLRVYGAKTGTVGDFWSMILSN